MKKIVISENENEYIIECDNNKIIISSDNNELSAKNLYDILDYKSGDKYEVLKKYGEENIDILDPIYEMLVLVVNKINEIEVIEQAVDRDLKEL